MLSHRTSACKCIECYISHVLWPQIFKYSNSPWKLWVVPVSLSPFAVQSASKVLQSSFLANSDAVFSTSARESIGDGEGFALFTVLLCLTKTQFANQEFIQHTKCIVMPQRGKRRTAFYGKWQLVKLPSEWLAQPLANSRKIDTYIRSLTIVTKMTHAYPNACMRQQRQGFHFNRDKHC